MSYDGVAVTLPSSIKSPVNSYARSPLVSVPSYNDPAKSHWEGVHSKIDTMTRVVSSLFVSSLIRKEYQS